MAIVACLFVGFPLWKIAERLGFSRPVHGIAFGALSGFLIGTGLIMRNVLGTGPHDSMGGSQGMEVIDGHYTALGWQHQFSTLPYLVLIGAIAGYFAVRVARRKLPAGVTEPG